MHLAKYDSQMNARWEIALIGLDGMFEGRSRLSQSAICA